LGGGFVALVKLVRVFTEVVDEEADVDVVEEVGGRRVDVDVVVVGRRVEVAVGRVCVC